MELPICEANDPEFCVQCQTQDCIETAQTV